MSGEEYSLGDLEVAASDVETGSTSVKKTREEAARLLLLEDLLASSVKAHARAFIIRKFQQVQKSEL